MNIPKKLRTNKNTLINIVRVNLRKKSIIANKIEFITIITSATPPVNIFHPLLSKITS